MKLAGRSFQPLFSPLTCTFCYLILFCSFYFNYVLIFMYLQWFISKLSDTLGGPAADHIPRSSLVKHHQIIPPDLQWSNCHWPLFYYQLQIKNINNLTFFIQPLVIRCEAGTRVACQLGKNHARNMKTNVWKIPIRASLVNWLIRHNHKS